MDRDLEIFRAVAEAGGYLHVDVIEMHFFPTRRKSNGRLKKLVDSGYLTVQKRNAGRYYTLTRKACRELASDTGIATPTLARAGMREAGRLSIHDANAGAFRLHLQAACAESKKFGVSFYSKMDRAYHEGDGRSFYRKSAEAYPDLTFCLQDLKTGDHILRFLEIDMQTESLRSNSRNASDIIGKVNRYRVYYDSGAYQEDLSGCFGGLRFDGFIVLFVVKSERRLKNIAKMIWEANCEDIFWLALLDDVCDPGKILGHCWCRADDPDTGLSLVGNRLEEAE